MAHETLLRGLSAAANTQGDGLDALVNMHVAMFGEDDPDTKFVRWCVESKRGPGLRAAAEEMGIEVEEGDDFFNRLRLAYIAKIEE